MSLFSKSLAGLAILATLGSTTALTACGGSTPGAKSGSNDSGDADKLKGKAAPDFTVTLKSGKKFSLGDAQGKVVIVDFWATWCGPCRESFPALQSLYEKKKAHGLVIVAINMDETTDEVDAFVSSTGAKFPIGLDPGEEKKVAGTKYPIPTMPTSYVIDQKGVVRYVHVGYHDEEPAELEQEVTKLLGSGGGGGGDEEE
jgi:thiol-disulfide isomerase/thioredoxin